MDTQQNQPVPSPRRAPRILKIRNLVVLGVILLASWLVVESPLFHKTAPAGTQLTDLHSVNQLRGLFNADTGTPRLILIFSPT